LSAPRSFDRKILSTVLRRIVVHGLLGVLLTYAAAAFVVCFLPIPTMSYSAKGRIHRADFGTTRPYLRLRVWESPHGTWFQIHRTRATRRVLRARLDIDGLSEEEAQALLENVKLDDPSFIPTWSVLHHTWPAGLADHAQLLAKGGMWYEMRMGWPLPCLRGGYTTPDSRGAGKVQQPYSAIPFLRPVRFVGPNLFGKIEAALPLIPTWPAFPACVCLYGIVTFGVSAGCRALLRRRRRRRGQCCKCGYVLKGLTEPRCPECGEPI